MLTRKSLPSPAIALLSLAPSMLACGAYEPAGDLSAGPTEEVQGAAFADTSALRVPALGSHNTVFTMCWDASALPTDASKALFDAGRAAVKKEITDTWDANSWVDFVWKANCNSGGIPIRIVDGTPSASRTRVTLNFKFTSFRPAECAPTGGNAPNAAWTNCVKKNAVHEFGHLLGFDHEQNRDVVGQNCGMGDIAEADNADGSIIGDLPFGPVDANSVMSYCWRNRTINLSNFDVDAVQSLYGAEGRSVRDGRFFAFHLGGAGRFMDVDAQLHYTTTPRLERALLVSGPTAGAAIRYGDRISIVFGNKKLCSTLGFGSPFGQFPPQLVFTDGPYDPAACIWEVRRDSSGVGGTTVNINDSVLLFLNAPVPVQNPGDQAFAIPFVGSLGGRFVGPFNPA